MNVCHQQPFLADEFSAAAGRGGWLADGIEAVLMEVCGGRAVTLRGPSDMALLACDLHLISAARFAANHDRYALPYIDELVARKVGGPEKATLPAADVAFHEAEVARLQAELEAASESSALPEAPADETRQALNDLLVRLRLEA